MDFVLCPAVIISPEEVCIEVLHVRTVGRLVIHVHVHSS